MKKLIYSMFIVMVLTALVITPVFAAWGEHMSINPKIMVAQTIWAGNVRVTGNLDGTMTFQIMLKGGQGYCFTEAAFHAGLSLDDFPQNNGGVIPGQFDYQLDPAGCISSYTMTIDPPGEYGDPVYIAMHFVVNGPGFEGETGWTVRCGNLEGGQFPGNNWSAWLLFPSVQWLLP
jgi:hypothetical protein